MAGDKGLMKRLSERAQKVAIMADNWRMVQPESFTDALNSLLETIEEFHAETKS